MSIMPKELAVAITHDVCDLRAWVKSEMGKGYMDWWKRAVDPLHYLQHGKAPLPKQVEEMMEARALTGDVMAPSVQRNFRRGFEKGIHGKVFYITPEMGDQAALRMIRRTEAMIEPHELIAPSGIVFLPVTSDMNFQKQSSFIGQEDITPAIAWNCEGDTVTLYWICDQMWNSFASQLMFLSGEEFWTTDPYVGDLNHPMMDPDSDAQAWIENELGRMMEASVDAENWPIEVSSMHHELDSVGAGSGLSLNGAVIQRLLPYHYWSPRTMSPKGERSKPLLRPDQPNASSPYFDDGQDIYLNKDGKSTKTFFKMEDEQHEQYVADMWFMIAYGCELIRMLGEDYRLAESIIPSASVDRSTQRKFQKRGFDKTTDISVYTLRKPVEEGLRREGRYYKRGPLTTRHHRIGHWRGNKGHAGELNCRHIWRAHKDDSNWRVCETCERVEHQVTDAIIGPEGAPFIENSSIGVLRR